ncbi:chemotaxis protein CheA [Candidatus Odyssella thessalonicensis]|uniref:chemotaxis protein CheA n=1 Tax=Candidatus Odyssella thessalonicensis TaxID=84647 RepID=UPI000225AF48|nr:chemotaxis protein CheA [Candidatus Odyssella thessalonicensis]
MDDLLTEFIVESTENISQLDEDLVVLEKDPHNPKLLENIFRALHTIKGTCGFIGMPRLEKVAHAGENVLGAMREGTLIANNEVISLILECIDTVKMILMGLAENSTEPPGDDEYLIQRLNGLLNVSEERGASITEEGIELSERDPLHDSTSIIDENKTESLSNDLLENLITEQKSLLSEETPRVLTQQNSSSKQAAEGEKDKEPLVANQSIRVNVSLLEELMTMISELVLTRNQLMQMVRESENNEFAVPLQRLNYVTAELQETVMKTRMQPIGTAWTKLPRLIRDLSNDLRKKIDLELIGSDTELDRQVIELIKDPLIHMVRNSADHGLENPHERLATGKDETGKITLNAYHAGGHIHIEIADDGRGLSLQKIKDKAIANGFIRADAADTVPESQIYQFIFKAGLSTAEKVTNVSGRGVGMDVVKTNIEKIGGTIDVKSVVNKGTKFTIKIPLTLTIVSSLITEVQGNRFAIPQLSVLELVKISRTSQSKIEYIKSHPVLRLRKKLLPLIFLKELLKLEPPREQEDVRANENCYIMILQVGEDVFGLIVDQVYDTQEIVVKPVSNLLRDVPIFGGNTILGDGSVIMILDPNGIAATLANSDVLDHIKNDFASEKAKKKAENKPILLIFQSHDQAYKAVPLLLVSRLEKFNVHDIEMDGDHYRAKYSEDLMPLLPIHESFTLPSDGSVPVLVFTRNGQSLGIIVSKIINTIEESIELKIKSDNPAVLGSTIVDGISTDIIDTEFYIQKAQKYWNNSLYKNLPIIYMGNKDFYISFLKPSLVAEGYNPIFIDNNDLSEDTLQIYKNAPLIALIEEDGQSTQETFSLLLGQDCKDLYILKLNMEPSSVSNGNHESTISVYKYDRKEILSQLSKIKIIINNIPTKPDQVVPGVPQ